MVRVAPYTSDSIRQTIIITVGGVKSDIGGREHAFSKPLMGKRKVSQREDGLRGASAVPFNRCFVDSFDIVVT